VKEDPASSPERGDIERRIQGNRIENGSAYKNFDKAIGRERHGNQYHSRLYQRPG